MKASDGDGGQTQGTTVTYRNTNTKMTKLEIKTGEAVGGKHHGNHDVIATEVERVEAEDRGRDGQEQ